MEIPYDIWVHVASFLDKKTVRGLYPVNRELFNISMDERYRDACVGYASPLESHLALRVTWSKIRDAFTASRVKHLALHSGRPDPCSATDHWQSDLSGLYHWILRTLWSTPEDIQRRKMDAEMQTVIANVPNMISVTALCIWLDSINDPYYASKLTVLKLGWPVYGPNLDSLVLKVPLEDLADILRGANKLPRLENFTIETITTFRTLASEANEHLCRTVVPFLKRHRTTLRSLTIEAKDNIDLSSFLSQLPTMPALVHFRLVQMFVVSRERVNTSGLSQFLNAHRLQIQKLDIRFTPRCTDSDLTSSEEYWFAQEIYRHHFPNLKSLKLNIPQLATSAAENTISHLHTYLSKLTFLELKSCTFSYDQITQLLSGLQGSNALRTLHIHTFGVTADLLLLFAEKLSQLSHLKLWSRDYLPNRDTIIPSHERIPEFCNVMRSKTFPEWNLYSLTIEPSLFPGAPRVQITMTIFTVLPKLQIFSGQDRKDAFSKRRDPLVDFGNAV